MTFEKSEEIYYNQTAQMFTVWIDIWATTWQKQQKEAAPSEDSDQPGHPPRLIWVFAGRTVILLVLSCRGSFYDSYHIYIFAIWDAKTPSICMQIYVQVDVFVWHCWRQIIAWCMYDCRQWVSLIHIIILLCHVHSFSQDYRYFSFIDYFYCK